MTKVNVDLVVFNNFEMLRGLINALLMIDDSYKLSENSILEMKMSFTKNIHNKNKIFFYGTQRTRKKPLFHITSFVNTKNLNFSSKVLLLFFFFFFNYTFSYLS